MDLDRLRPFRLFESMLNDALAILDGLLEVDMRERVFVLNNVRKGG